MSDKNVYEQLTDAIEAVLKEGHNSPEGEHVAEYLLTVFVTSFEGVDKGENRYYFISRDGFGDVLPLHQALGLASFADQWYHQKAEDRG